MIYNYDMNIIIKKKYIWALVSRWAYIKFYLFSCTGKTKVYLLYIKPRFKTSTYSEQGMLKVVLIIVLSPF